MLLAQSFRRKVDQFLLSPDLCQKQKKVMRQTKEKCWPSFGLLIPFVITYIYGSAQVNIYTDHQPLTGSLSHKSYNGKMKRWKSLLEEYNHKMYYKPGSTNVVADALSRPPGLTQVTSVTTQHSADSSAHGLIYHTDAPINVFRNQVLFEIGNKNSYKFNIIFPKYHRHSITQSNYSEVALTTMLKKYLNPCVVNGIIAPERILGKIQEIYRTQLSAFKIRFTNHIVQDVQNEQDQENIIVRTHTRAHRNAAENKLQILQNFYFPSMANKIKKVVKTCHSCKVNKYERHPNKPKLAEAPLPEYPGHTLHIDIYSTEKNLILTALDKFSKFAQGRIIHGKDIESIRHSLRELLFYFAVPKVVVIDNERSLNSESILFMMRETLNIEVSTTPPYRSEVNGQVERFHSTLTEIMRCLKSENTHRNFEELLQRAINEYNHSFHSTTKHRPVDVFFGRNIHCTPQDYETARQNNIEKLCKKQQQDLEFHNKNRQAPKEYLPGAKIFVKGNKRLGSKLSQRYKEEVVKENYNSTVVTESGRVVHKSHIRN